MEDESVFSQNDKAGPTKSIVQINNNNYKEEEKKNQHHQLHYQHQQIQMK